jgi:hypothetical protein
MGSARSRPVLLSSRAPIGTSCCGWPLTLGNSPHCQRYPDHPQPYPVSALRRRRDRGWIPHSLSIHRDVVLSPRARRSVRDRWAGHRSACEGESHGRRCAPGRHDGRRDSAAHRRRGAARGICAIENFLSRRQKVDSEGAVRSPTTTCPAWERKWRVHAGLTKGASQSASSRLSLLVVGRPMRPGPAQSSSSSSRPRSNSTQSFAVRSVLWLPWRKFSQTSIATPSGGSLESGTLRSGTRQMRYL